MNVAFKDHLGDDSTNSSFLLFAWKHSMEPARGPCQPKMDSAHPRQTHQFNDRITPTHDKLVNATTGKNTPSFTANV